MSPLPEEAIARGGFDAIVNREGEDIIGQLCDILLTFRDDRKYQYLERVAGISFMRDGHVTQTRRKGLVAPRLRAPARLPLHPRPVPHEPHGRPVSWRPCGGCTENCSYCQGHPAVSSATASSTAKPSSSVSSSWKNSPPTA